VIDRLGGYFATMKRAIKSRPLVGATATVVLRRAVVLPRVVSSLPTIVIVRRGTLELGRNGRTCCVGDRQAIVVPAGMAFDFTYRPDKSSGFLAQWLLRLRPRSTSKEVRRGERVLAGHLTEFSATAERWAAPSI